VAWANSPPTPGTATKPGSPPHHWPRRCSPGWARCVSTATSPTPNPTPSATGYCTSPRNSPAGNDGATCAWTRPGPGPPTSSAPSPASKHSPQAPNQHKHTPTTPREEATASRGASGAPGHRPDSRHPTLPYPPEDQDPQRDTELPKPTTPPPRKIEASDR